jgi:predicted lipid-binding transport protein (Tim44 family)
MPGLHPGLSGWRRRRRDPGEVGLAAWALPRGPPHTNRVDRLDIRRAEVSEAWQEVGQDYVTVLVAASMLDYTVDDATGAVVEGSRTVPQEIEDFWTFTRPVGNNPWKLSAIQTT